MYLIQYKLKHAVDGKVIVGADTYKDLIEGYDVQDALSRFYNQHKYFGISDEMFETIVRKIDLTSSIALHNALRPDHHIISIIHCDDRPLYIEQDFSKSEDDIDEK